MDHGLPISVVLKSPSNNKYLRNVSENSTIHTFLKCSGEKALSPDSMFELEIPKSAKLADLGLVHIRSTYNNRYCRRWSNITDFIATIADEPIEDQKEYSCTLFQPSFVDDSKTRIKLRHVQQQSYVFVWQRPGDPYDSCLHIGSSGEAKDDDGSTFEVINRESLVVFPEYVAFKGNNGHYLNARSFNNSNILEFTSSDFKDPSVMHKVTNTNDGTRVRLISVHFDKFWRLNTSDSFNYIKADSDETTDKDGNTLFFPVKVNHNHVALQSMGNNKFVKRFSYMVFKEIDYLAALGSTTTDVETNLEVFVPIASREIINVQFRLMDARIYNKKVIIMFTQEVTNAGSMPLTSEIKLPYANLISKWDTYYHSFKLDLEVKFSSGTPYIQNGEIVVHDEYESPHKWGESKTSRIDVGIAKTFVVSPRTKFKVSLIATEGTIDVPFSYTQKDTFYNGKRVTYDKNDGIYTGTNTYNFKLDTQEAPL